MRAKKTPITVWTADDVCADKSLCGLNGSPTQVVKTFVPVHDVVSEIIEGEPEQQAKQLAEKLHAMKFKK